MGNHRVFLTAEIWLMRWFCVQQEVPQTFPGVAGSGQKRAEANQSSKWPFRGRDESSECWPGAQESHAATAQAANTACSALTASRDACGTLWPGSKAPIWLHLCAIQHVQGHGCRGKSWSFMPWGWAGQGVMWELLKTSPIHPHSFGPSLGLRQLFLVQHQRSNSLRHSFQQAGKEWELNNFSLSPWASGKFT